MIFKFRQRKDLEPDIDDLRNDLLSTANKLDAFAHKGPWPQWIKRHSEMLRKLSRDINDGL